MKFLGGFFCLLLLSPVFAQADAWNIDQFLKSLHDQKPKTIEEALLSLPPAVRSSFTLLYDGHGLRGTSYERPGVILFSQQGEFAITFGDASLEMGDDLEMAIFREPTAKFEFYRASFPKAGGVVVEKNPQKCLTCHESDPMYRWGTYLNDEYKESFWPGVYGSMDDVIAVPGTHADRPANWPPYLEHPHFVSFMSQMKNLERYRTLIPPKAVVVHSDTDDDSPMSPYTDIEKDPRLEIRPNDLFTEIVARQNGKRLARKLSSAPLFNHYAHWLLYQMIGCGKNDGAVFAATPAQMNQLSMNLTADLLKSNLSGDEKNRLSKSILSIETILELLGASFDDLQPNILTPAQKGVYPFFFDGIIYSLDNALGVNSVDYFAAHGLLRKVLALFPNATLAQSYRVLAAEASDQDYFHDYPESLQIDENMDRLETWIDWDFAKSHGMCDELLKQAVK